MEQMNELKVVSIRLVDEPPLFSKRELTSPKSVFEFMGQELQKYDREFFCVLNLKSNNQVINMNVVSVGTLNTALAHPREVFKSAVLSNAAGIILLHNHPSGNCSPSLEDHSITKRMQAAGKIMGIPVMDHVIVAGNDYYSFLENENIIKKDGNYGEYIAEKSVPQRERAR